MLEREQVATLQDQGSDDTVDSDGDPDTHLSGPVSLGQSEHIGDVDFGFYDAALEETGNEG